MGKVLFWLVWAVEVAAFVFVGGCFVLLLGIEGRPFARDQFIMLMVVLAACAVALFGLIKAVNGFRRGQEAGEMALYLALPPLAAFLAFGTCSLVFR